jgi:uncharacterized protein YqhQ
MSNCTLMENSMSASRPIYYGGQAVIEGVMMRGREKMAVAVRRPTGELSVTSQPLPGLYKGRLRELPFLRGIIILIETLALGVQSILHSAQIAAAEEEQKSLSPAALWGTVALGIGFGIALFFVLPLLITRYLIDPYITSALLSNIVEGVLRIGVFIAYLKIIALMPDIKRLFAYHGAEHKVVNAYESGMPLELTSVKGYSTSHVRCGTSFLVAVLVIAIFVFALFGRPSLWLSILSRIVLIPVIAALGYEFVRFSAAHSDSPVMRSLIIPGLWLQSLTTREPDDAQLEAALVALRTVVEADSSSPQ